MFFPSANCAPNPLSSCALALKKSYLMTISAEAEKALKDMSILMSRMTWTLKNVWGGGGCFPWTLSQQLVTSDYYLDLLLDPHRPPAPLQYLQWQFLFSRWTALPFRISTAVSWWVKQKKQYQPQWVPRWPKYTHVQFCVCVASLALT